MPHKYLPYILHPTFPLVYTMPSVSRQSTVKSLSPRIVKKVEQEIFNEARSEEQSLKAAVKDLHNTEKDEQKANKVINPKHAFSTTSSEFVSGHRQS